MSIYVNVKTDQHDGSVRKCCDSTNTCGMNHSHLVSSINGFTLSRTLKPTVVDLVARKAFAFDNEDINYFFCFYGQFINT
jgi:hypothetical protein